MGLVRGCQPQSENKWESCGQEEILDSDGTDSGPTSLGPTVDDLGKNLSGGLTRSQARSTNTFGLQIITVKTSHVCGQRVGAEQIFY